MTSTLDSQEKNKNLSPISAQTLLAELPPKQKAVLELLSRRATNGVIRISYAEIMSCAKVGRSTVRVTINKLRDMGLLRWQEVYHNFNVFHLDKELLQPKLRNMLMSFVRNVALFATIFLTSKRASAGDQPLLRINEFKRGNISNSHIVNSEGQVAYATNFYQIGFENEQALRDAGGFESEQRERALQEKRHRKYLRHEKLREQAINDISKAMPLTSHGRAKLFAYPAAALRFVFFKVESCYGKEDPFIYMISILERYCRENSYHIERPRYKKKCRELGANKTDDFVEDELLALIVADRANRPPHMAERYIARSLKREHALQQLKPQSHLPFQYDERICNDIDDREESFQSGIAKIRAMPDDQKSWFHTFVIDLADRDKESKNN